MFFPQAQVQRLLSIGSLRRSQLSLWLQWPILTALSLCTSFAGLTIYAHYAGCDPVRAGRIAKGDQLLPLFVVDTMRGVPAQHSLVRHQLAGSRRHGRLHQATLQHHKFHFAS